MLNRTHRTVERILQAAPITRSSDKKLLVDYWYVMGLELTKEQQEKFLDLPSPETVTRVRRKLQSEGKYLATLQVATARVQQMEEMSDYARY